MNTSRLYERPLTDKSLSDERAICFGGSDAELIQHLGHFIAWFSACEFTLTLLLHKFCGHSDPTTFHTLIKGMDARKKLDTLRQVIKQRKGWKIGSTFQARLEHFEGQAISGLRNKLVHSHLYWPEGQDLQMTSIGAPPEYDDFKVAGVPPPERVSGDTIFERGLWLRAFSVDVGGIYKAAEWPLAPTGVLQTSRYQSPLPKGNHPPTHRKAGRAK